MKPFQHVNPEIGRTYKYWVRSGLQISQSDAIHSDWVGPLTVTIPPALANPRFPYETRLTRWPDLISTQKACIVILTSAGTECTPTILDDVVGGVQLFSDDPPFPFDYHPYPHSDCHSYSND